MYDVIVIGAGPAGANAALGADQKGLKVLMIDEQKYAGGQVWRQKSKSILKAPGTEASENGSALGDKISRSKVDVRYNSRVWHIEKEDDGSWLIAAERERLKAKALIISTGAQERIIPIPGWTLPGVMGLGAATVLFKEHMMVPQGRTIVAGNGPLLFYVASEIIRLGGQVAAVVSLNSKKDWKEAFPEMVSNKDLLWQGLKWMFQLYKRRVPIFWQHGIKKIEGESNVDGATICKVDDNWKPESGSEQNIAAETVCLGHGLMPSIEATRLAGAYHKYDQTLGGWVPIVDKHGRTTHPKLYACGDNAGILGAFAAPFRGKLAASAVIKDLMGSKESNIDQETYDRAVKFGLAATALSIPRAGLADFMTMDTIVCRCEEITRGEIEHEIRTGAITPNAIKSGTRCGMGPCGGRYCAEAQAMITKHITGQTNADIGLPTSRSPLRPVPIDEISGKFKYDELEVPGVSPQ